MRNNKFLAQFLFGALAVSAVGILLLIIMRPGKTTVNEEPPSVHIFQLPNYVRLDSEDTYRGEVDVTGVWVNPNDDTDVVELHSDGTYVSSRLANEGTYTVEIGYVAMVSNGEVDTALRMVQGEGIDIILQKDETFLSRIYQRDISGEVSVDAAINTNNDPNGEAGVNGAGGETGVIELDSLDDRLRMHLEAVHEIFQASAWTPQTSGVGAIGVTADKIYLYESRTDRKALAEWSYSLLPPEDKVIPSDPPYYTPISIDGIEYVLTLDAGKYPQYSKGFYMTIANDDAVLLEAVSTNKVYVGGAH